MILDAPSIVCTSNPWTVSVLVPFTPAGALIRTTSPTDAVFGVVHVRAVVKAALP